MTTRQTALLLILDGWGYREATESNAIHAAQSPVWDNLWRNHANTLIYTSGTAVGLPAGQMGNSEVGHMNLGAGRVVYQSLTRIDKAIKDGDFFHNPVLCAAIDKAVAANRAIHLFGLLSAGGIHSHEDHIMAAMDLAIQRGASQIYLHAILDGRDTPPRSALPSLLRAETMLEQQGKGRIASLCGRFYAMDRDQRWDRVQIAYDLLTLGEADFVADDVTSALESAYGRNEDDEFVQATLLKKANEEAVLVSDGDVVLFMNFRADRARQLTRAFVDEDFDGFKRKMQPKLGEFVMLTEYAADIDTVCAYPPQTLSNVLGEILANNRLTQLRIAETEKYAHVTFFFNGGREEPFALEDRTLIPSPKVKTYDLKPEMAAYEVTEALVDAITSGQYNVIICNYANGDMVGHTGNFNAAVAAVEVLDQCLGRIVAAIESISGHMLITADHGNVEQMVDPKTGQPLTSHTKGPVPLVYVGSKDWRIDTAGSLCDIAPTLLTLIGLPVPVEMTGKVLLKSIAGNEKVA